MIIKLVFLGLVGLFLQPRIAAEEFGHNDDLKKLVFRIDKTGDDASTTTTTLAPPATTGCTREGKTWSEGEIVIGVEGPCETCFCYRGEIKCNSLTCDPPLQGCTPVKEEGRCCPVSYDCNKAIDDSVLQSANGVRSEPHARNMPPDVAEADVVAQPGITRKVPLRRKFRRPFVTRRRISPHRSSNRKTKQPPTTSSTSTTEAAVKTDHSEIQKVAAKVKTSTRNTDLTRNRSRFKGGSGFSRFRKNRNNRTRITSAPGQRQPIRQISLKNVKTKLRPTEVEQTSKIFHRTSTDDGTESSSTSETTTSEYGLSIDTSAVPSVSHITSEVYSDLTTTTEATVTEETGVNTSPPINEALTNLTLYQKLLNFNGNPTFDNTKIEKETFDKIEPLKEIKNSLRADRQNRKRNENIKTEENVEDIPLVTEYPQEESPDEAEDTNLPKTVHRSFTSNQDSLREDRKKRKRNEKIKIEQNEVIGEDVSLVTEYPQEDSTTLSSDYEETHVPNLKDMIQNLFAIQDRSENETSKFTSTTPDINLVDLSSVVTTRLDPEDETGVTELLITETETPIIDNIENEPDIIDSEFIGFSQFPTYDVKVGASIFSEPAIQKDTVVGVGEVVPFELVAEHKSPGIITPSTTEVPKEVEPESSSFLSAIFNMLRRPDRPRRPRPPTDRLNGLRPNLNRTRLTRPTLNRTRPTRPLRRRPERPGRPNRPFFTPNDRPNIKETEDTTEKLTTPNDDSIPPQGGSIISASFNVLSNNQDDHPKPFNEIDNIPANEVAFTLLPSEPVIESGFQGIRDGDNEFDIEDRHHISNDENDKPTLPPSLPNLRIIPFVAADALVDKETGLSIDDFRATTKLSKSPDSSAQDRVNDNTVSPNTTPDGSTRRPLIPRLPVGNRRTPTPLKSSEAPESISRRPLLPFRRPGSRPRPSHSFTNTNENSNISENDESKTKNRPTRPSLAFFNRDRFKGSTRPPFIPPRRPSLTRFTPRPTTEAVTELEEIAVTEETVIVHEPNPTLEAEIKEDIIDIHEFPSFFQLNTQRPIHPASLRPNSDRPIHPASLRPSLLSPKQTTITPVLTTPKPSSSRPTLPEPPTPRTSEPKLPTPRPSVPKFATPRPSLPKLATPRPSLPKLATPRPSLPKLPTPRPSLPKFSTSRPSLSLPKFPISRPHLTSPKQTTSRPIFSEIDSAALSSKENDLLSFLNGNINDPNLLPRPISTSSIHSDDIANLLLQDKFDMPDGIRQPVRFSAIVPTKSPVKPRRTTTPLPKIPDEVKAQLPLGIDPILASGLLQLAGCNVYGRMYKVDQQIIELTAECKECRCTQVGVQCLPTC